jgi:hypothetical protein
MRMDQTTQKSRNDTEAGESLHHEEVASTTVQLLEELIGGKRGE